MAIGITNPQADTLRERIQADRFYLILAALGFAPLLYFFFRLSWVRPAYQFYPLALVAAGLLAWRAIKQTKSAVAPGNLWLTRWLILVAGIVFLLANYLWSPWLAFVAFLLALLAVVWGGGGQSLLKVFVPVLLMLLTILPPPFGWDQELVLWLRAVAVNTSSALLDSLQVTHLRDGNTLLLPGKKLLVEEACSGINSFVLCNACCLFWFLWRRRPLTWLFVGLPLISLFVVLGNVIRITLGTAADYYWQFNLLSGWRHETFGLGLLLGYCVLILSVEQLLVFLTKPVYAKSADPTVKPALQPDRLGPEGLRPRPVFKLVGVLLAVVGIGFFAAHLFAGGRHGLAALPKFSAARELKLTLPDRLAGWQRLNAEAGDQTLVQTLGVHSTLWHFQRQGSEAVVAVDYPLDGFHNVKVCYQGNGWQPVSEAELLLPSSKADLHTIQLTLEKSIHHAVVYHSVMDARGDWLSAPQMRGRFADTSISGSVQTGYRVQLITGGYSPLSSAATAAAQDLFFQARQTLVPQMVEQLRKGASR